MTASLARFLPDFEVAGINGLHANVHERRAADIKAPAQPEIDVEKIRAQAFAQGEAEGFAQGEAKARAELLAQFEAERQALEEQHVAQMEALRTDLQMVAAEGIPQVISARNDQIAEEIASDVEAVLMPLVEATIRQKMLSNLAGEIRACLELDNASQIRVAGPEDLLAALRSLLPGEVEKIDFHETQSFDIEIEVDRTRFTSRLAQWSKTLGESLL